MKNAPKFNPERLEYHGRQINDIYVDHEFSTSGIDCITLTYPPDGAPYSTLRVATSKVADFGEPKQMSDAFTQLLIARLDTAQS